MLNDPRPLTGLLDAYLAACERFGWDPQANIRMEADGEADGDLDEDPEEDDGDPAEDDREEDASSDQVARLRKEAAKRRTQLKPWKDLERDLGMTADEIRAALESNNERGDDKDTQTHRRPARRSSESEDRANRKLVRAEVKLAAADLFADPSDAALYVDLDKYEVDEDGDLIDIEELLDDLAEVLEKKPHLAKAKERKGPKPLKGQGRRDANTSGLDAGAEVARRRFGTDPNTTRSQGGTK